MNKEINFGKMSRAEVEEQHGSALTDKQFSIVSEELLSIISEVVDEELGSILENLDSIVAEAEWWEKQISEV
jgi:hypothetical protein